MCSPYVRLVDVDIIPWSLADAPGPKKKQKESIEKQAGSGPTLLDNFVRKKPDIETQEMDDDAEEYDVGDDIDGDVVMLEDGTMTGA